MMSFGFGDFEAMFTLAFVFVFGLIVVSVIRGISTWNRNNNSPRLVVAAEVVTKREDVSHSSMPVAGDATGAHGFHTSSSTAYYVTFEVKGGDRLEFNVSGTEYDQLAEGDRGELTMQGTRYLGFVRQQ